MRHPEKGFKPIPPHGSPRPEYKRVRLPDGRISVVPTDSLGGSLKRIFILKEQLFYDIDAQASIILRSRRTEGMMDNNATPDSTESFRPLLMRWIDKYYLQAKGRLQAYVIEQDRGSGMNGIDQKDEVEIELLMPPTWDETVFPQLINAVHDYIVNSVLFEYLSLSLTAKDPVVMSKQEASLLAYDDIKRFSSMPRPGTVHKPLQPF